MDTTVPETNPAQTFDDGVREERARIAAWLDEQRKDIPAHGWEFAAALRAQDQTPKMDDVFRALNLMWAFATSLVERHGMNGDDTMTDADHRAWQEAAGVASAALGSLSEAIPDWGYVSSNDVVEFRPLTSAARQWAIDAMPDGLNPVGGTYRVEKSRADQIVQMLRDEEFVITEWKGA